MKKEELHRLQSDPRQPCAEISAIYANECLSCGVCCVFYSQRPFGVPVQVNDATPLRLVQIGPRLKTTHPDKAWLTNRYMRNEPLKAKAFRGWKGFKKCISLEGEIGKAACCGIYDQRPTACSDFAPGSPACVRARRWVNAPVPRDLMELGHS